MSIPNTIVLANSKGGAGKTAIVRSLTAYWHVLGFLPGILDADPQGSISKRHDPEGPLGDVLIIRESDERYIESSLEELKGQGRYPIIVDTGGFENRTAYIALLASDIALIPLKPAGDDIDEAISTYETIQQLSQTPERNKVGKPIIARFLLTMVKANTVIANHIREELTESGYPVLKTNIADRVAFAEDGLRGLAPPITDPNGVASRDVAALAAEISALYSEFESSSEEAGKAA